MAADKSVDPCLFLGIDSVRSYYFRVARKNEAARAADAAECLETSVGTVFLKNGWYRM